LNVGRCGAMISSWTRTQSDRPSTRSVRRKIHQRGGNEVGSNRSLRLFEFVGEEIHTRILDHQPQQLPW
jgi:hypothetical protein